MATIEQAESTPEATGSKPLPKDEFIAVLEAQPADSSYDELLKELVIRRAIERGLADVDAGRVVSNEEAVARIRSWRK